MSTFFLDDVTEDSLRRLAELCRETGLALAAVEFGGVRLELAIPEVHVSGLEDEEDCDASA